MPDIPQPESVGRVVLGRLAEADLRFVFPSEVAARSWLERALAASGLRALPAGRFVSWDAFKAIRFPGPPDRLPCPKLVRALFARALMAKNAASPFLRAVVPPESASSSPRFARAVAAALPFLQALPEGRGDELEDWRAIRRRYADFLASRGLYEASWNPRAAAPGRERWVLFFPDLTEDWADYEAAVRALPDVELVESSALPAGPVPAAGFGTLVDETRAVLLKIRELAAGGVDPADIAITVAAPESALPVLEREAAVAGVPLDAREAYVLSESAGGRLLADLLDLARTRSSFESVRRLLLDLSRPWKDAAAARELVALGIRKHVLAPLPDLGSDIWEASMEAGTPAAVRSLYRGLAAAARRLSSAQGFDEARAAFDAFRRDWLREDGWSPAQDDELARCVVELELLADAANRAGLDAPGSAAEAWLEHLEDVRYLPVSARAGIPVYRFPVAAGSSPAAHFIVNLAEGAAVSSARPLAFLRDDVRQRAGAADRDLSPGLVRLLARSGAAVWASWSEDGPDGVRPPHPAVRSEPPAALGLGYPREAWLPNRDEDRSGAVPREVFPVQRLGAAAAAATVAPPAERPLTAGRPDRPVKLDPALLSRILEPWRDGRGRLMLSDTLVEGYGSCAFRWLFSRAFGVEEEATGLSFVDALMVGRLYHDCLARVFGALAEEGLPVVQAVEAGESPRPSADALGPALDAAMAGAGREHGPFALAMLGSMRPELLRNLSLALDRLRATLDGLVPVLVESPLDAELPGLPEAVLRGRADLVCAPPRGAAEAVIVDYKKRGVPGKKELAVDGTRCPSRLQMPMYAALVESAGLTAVRGWYQPVEGDSRDRRVPREAFGPGKNAAVPPERFADWRRCLADACARTARGLSAGEIFVPSKADQQTVCAGCGLRPTCRERYAVP